MKIDLTRTFGTSKLGKVPTYMSIGGREAPLINFEMKSCLTAPGQVRKKANRDGSNGWAGSALTVCSRVDHGAARLVSRPRTARLHRQMDAASNRRTRSVYMGLTTWLGWVQHQQLRAPSDNDYSGRLGRPPRLMYFEDAGQTRVVPEGATASGKLIGKLPAIAVIAGTLWHFFCRSSELSPAALGWDFYLALRESFWMRRHVMTRLPTHELNGII